MSIQEQITEIEKELRETPHHKATDHHIGRLRAKLSRLKDKEVEAQSRKSGGGGGYAVKKQGDATVVLVGPPSAGKSTLLNSLTNAESRVAPYAFTTVSVIPGMMKYREAYIQILDVPGLIEGAEEGKGRGREVLSVVRGADLLVLISDITRPEAIERISEALERNGIRINKTPPEVKIEKKLKGGIVVKTNIKQEFDNEMVREVAGEMGMKNGEIQIREKLTLDQLVDVFSKSRVYVPAINVLNKADMASHSEPAEESLAYTRTRSLDFAREDMLKISAETGQNLEEFKQLIWEKLQFITVYLVKRDEEPNHNNPIIMKKGQTLQDVVNSIGTDFAESHTKARIWGQGAKFDGQQVSLKTHIQDGMMVRFI